MCQHRSAGHCAHCRITPPLSCAPCASLRKSLLQNRLEKRCKTGDEVLFAGRRAPWNCWPSRDPEEASPAARLGAGERMMAAVHRHEGTVNQVLGDGIMALFGAPIAHEDHAGAGLLCRVGHAGGHSTPRRRTPPCTGIEVQIQVGLNSGEVVVRAIGNDLHTDYSAIGQATHLAARMEQLATPGSIPPDGRDLAAR